MPKQLVFINFCYCNLSRGARRYFANCRRCQRANKLGTPTGSARCNFRVEINQLMACGIPFLYIITYRIIRTPCNTYNYFCRLQTACETV